MMIVISQIESIQNYVIVSCCLYKPDHTVRKSVRMSWSDVIHILSSRSVATHFWENFAIPQHMWDKWVLLEENSDFGQENLAPFIVKANNKRYYILRSFMKHIPLATAGGVSFSSIDWYMINHWNAQRVKSKIGYVTRFKYQLHYHDTAKNFTLYINPVTKIRRNPLVH